MQREWCAASWGQSRSMEALPVGFVCQLVLSCLPWVLWEYYVDISEHSDIAGGSIVRLDTTSGSSCVQGVQTRGQKDA